MPPPLSRPHPFLSGKASQDGCVIGIGSSLYHRFPTRTQYSYPVTVPFSPSANGDVINQSYCTAIMPIFPDISLFTIKAN